METKEQRFIRLAKEMEAKSEEMNALREELNAAMADMGVNTYAQDPVTLLVYKVIKPQGTFTYFRDLDYKRTAKEGEKGGTVLAKSEAEEAGFTLPAKKK